VKPIVAICEGMLKLDYSANHYGDSSLHYVTFGMTRLRYMYFEECMGAGFVRPHTFLFHYKNVIPNEVRNLFYKKMVYESLKIVTKTSSPILNRFYFCSRIQITIHTI